MMRLLLVGIVALSSSYLNAQDADPDVRAILRANASLIDHRHIDSVEYSISSAYTSAHLGITHVYLEQRHRDIRVYNGILNLNLSGEKLVSAGNRWITDIHTTTPSPAAAIAPQVAAQAAAHHLDNVFRNASPVAIEENRHKQLTKVTYPGGALSEEDIPVELVWLKEEGDRVLLCWLVEIHETGGANVWRIFIDAHTGSYVRKDNLVVHCEFASPEERHAHCSHASPVVAVQSPVMFAPDSSYKVFAMPVESPNHGARTVVERPWMAAGAGHPAVTLGWHSTGATNYTRTRGNNVHAYEDINNDGLPGFSPDTFNLRFDYPFDPYLHPHENMAAAVTNLFFWNNLLHDISYIYGFDEPAGNFQVNNLGRGGAQGDDVRAEALDGGGTNNANFFTPSDGNRPRMQMYLWSAVSSGSLLTINSPESIAGGMNSVESVFSNNNRIVDVGLTEGDLILVLDSGGSSHLACGTIINSGDLAGKIAVIDRGDCNFTVKVKNVQNHGAIAAIVINNVSDPPFAMGGTDHTIVIPAVMISLSDGNTLKNVMSESTVHATLDAVQSIIPDGDYDNAIIAHEYAHGVSNRLTGGPSQVGCLSNAEQMGEGWSDYFGLMLTTDWSTAHPEDTRGIGTYVRGQPTDGLGIRTYPYTTDMQVNPFTYASITNSSSVHYIGSVWCTMLWDMTWKIIEIAGTDPDMYHGAGGNNIAFQLVMDGLKLQPCSPGFVDGRNAILLADQLRYGGQYSCAIWEAFARRGLGINADQGSSNNRLDGVESFDIPSGVRVINTIEPLQVLEGQEATITLKAICGCEEKNDLEIRDILSDDLIYVEGSGGIPDGNAVVFVADVLNILDTLEFSYRARVRPCTPFAPVSISEDYAEGTNQYVSVKLGGTGTRQWVKTSTLSRSAPNSWYARDYTSYSDYVLTLINPLQIDGPVEVSFYHRYETEATYDGGVVEYSRNGTTWLDAGQFFVQNGYPSAIVPNTNSPIAGRPAFTGNSNTQFNTTTWVHSVLRINSPPGLLYFRFRFACDGSVGGPGINGWYVDDIVISQISGAVNETRLSAESILLDSMPYVVMTIPFEGHTLYLDQQAASGGTGGSWEDAMHTLTGALEIAGCRSVDSVFVTEGIYYPTLNGDRHIAFHLPDNTQIFGGFPHGGSPFASRDPALYETILSGDIGIENDPSDNSYHVVCIDSAKNAIVLDGVTIRGGNADGADDASRGAGVFCKGGLTLQDVIFQQNTGLSDGQVILVRDSAGHLILRDCILYTGDDGKVKILNLDGGQVTIDGNVLIMEE